MGKSMVTLATTAKSCEGKMKNKTEMKVFIEMSRKFAALKAVGLEKMVLSAHIILGGVDIYHEIRAAYTNYFAHKYEEFGRDIGAALALVYIGPSGVAKLTEAEREKLKDLLEDSMYPSLSPDTFTDENNKAYLEYLIFLYNARMDLDLDVKEPHIDDIFVPAKPVLRDEDAEDSEIEDYLDGEAYYDKPEFLQMY